MTPTAATHAGPSRSAALTGVTASITVFALAQGLSNPLFTFLMQKQGHPAAFIGLSAAMTPIGLMLSAALIPVAVTRYGARAVAVVSALSAAILFVAIGLMQDWIAWLLVRFLIGFAINPLYVLGEVWMLALASDGTRGRVMGLFTAITGAGYATGPLVLVVGGTEGWLPLAIGAGGFVGCAALLFLVARNLAGFEGGGEGDHGVMAFWRTAPALLLAVVVSAAIQQSVYSLMPVFGSAYGLPEARLAALITGLSLGNIVMQLPLGFLAERFGARRMIVACAATEMVCASLLPFVVTTPLVWAVVLIMGGVGYGIYTMALVELGNRFSGAALIAGNAAFAMMWGAGGIVGPPGAGVGMQLAGPVGLPVLIVGFCAGLVAFIAYRDAMRRRRGLESSA